MYAEKGEWHLSKSVSLSHILSTIGLVIILVGIVQAAEKRMTRVEQAQTNTISKVETQEAAVNKEITEVKEAVEKLDQEQKELRRELRADGDRREEKLDRLIEHIMKNGH